MKKEKTVGVVVGRFQVDQLTDGHRSVISSLSNFEYGIIFIGTTKDGKLDKKNPLPYQARKDIISNFISFHNIPATVIEITDLGDPKRWVEMLESKIEAARTLGIIPEDAVVTLLGSRDSFIDQYREFGTKYAVQSIPEYASPSNRVVSGTARRDQVKEPEWTQTTREAVIWACNNIREV